MYSNIEVYHFRNRQHGKRHAGSDVHGACVEATGVTPSTTCTTRVNTTTSYLEINEQDELYEEEGLDSDDETSSSAYNDVFIEDELEDDEAADQRELPVYHSPKPEMRHQQIAHRVPDHTRQHRQRQSSPNPAASSPTRQRLFKVPAAADGCAYSRLHGFVAGHDDNDEEELERKRSFEDGKLGGDSSSSHQGSLGSFMFSSHFVLFRLISHFVFDFLLNFSSSSISSLMQTNSSKVLNLNGNINEF